MQKLIGRLHSDHVLAVLRIALGLVFVIGGIKLAFPADATALANSYVDPSSGWISIFYQQLITENLGLEISEFLRIQGMIEIMLGLALILGMFTPLLSALMGVMFLGFVVANPDIGEIRLARDIALAGLAFSISLAGGGTFSMDGLMFKKRSRFVEYREPVLFLIRVSLALALAIAALFTPELFPQHHFGNVLNSMFPVEFVFILAGMLLLGFFPRIALVLFSIWMIYLIGASLLAKPFYLALDGVKREIGFLGASLVYVFLGPDRLSWPRIG